MKTNSNQGRAIVLFLSFCLLFVSSCTKPVELITVSGGTMGTYYSVKYLNDFPSISKEQAKKDIELLLKEVNRQMSTYIPTSEISQFNQQAKTTDFKISEDFYKVAKFSLQLARDTKGSFDPTVGPLVNLWGFGPEGKRRKPTAAKLKKELAKVGYNKVEIKNSEDKYFLVKKNPLTQLDLSATAKGFAVDKISDYLRSQQLINHLVDIGGELKASGQKTDSQWLVGIEKPGTNSKGVQRKFALRNQAIASSGSYRNYFTQDGVNYNHNIDSKTGQSIVSDLVSASVVADTCLEADGLATALMTMGFDKAKTYIENNNLKAFLMRFNSKENKIENFDRLSESKK